jgi:perosamine synthetase
MVPISDTKTLPDIRGIKRNAQAIVITSARTVLAACPSSIARLKEHGIYCRAAFACMSGFPIHQRRFPNPVAEKVERRGLCLPSAAQLTEEDIDFVCEKLLRLLRP